MAELNMYLGRDYSDTKVIHPKGEENGTTPASIVSKPQHLNKPVNYENKVYF